MKDDYLYENYHYTKLSVHEGDLELPIVYLVTLLGAVDQVLFAYLNRDLLPVTKACGCDVEQYTHRGGADDETKGEPDHAEASIEAQDD